MKKLYSYTIFIDILGYSNHLNKISNNNEATEIFDLLEEIEESIQEYYNGTNGKNSHKEYNMHYTFFSDCIILSFIPKNNLNIEDEEVIFYNGTTLGFIFTWIMNIQLITLLKTGFLLRGGISIKEIYWKENKVVGPGLIEAYNLESKKANWARIILSEDLTNDTNLIKHVNNINYNNVYLEHDLIYKYENESYSYYNYIGRMLARLNVNVPNSPISDNTFLQVVEITDLFFETHKKIIMDNLEHKEEKIRNKYKELKKYHNKALKDFIEVNKNFNEIGIYIIN